VEAAANKIGSPADQILLFCFHYDPAEGKYGPIIMNFVRLGGILTLLGLGTFLTVLWRGEWRTACGLAFPALSRAERLAIHFGRQKGAR